MAGAFVNVRVVTEIKHDATVVPSQAVQRGPTQLFVYVVKPDQTVEMRPVTAAGTAAWKDAHRKRAFSGRADHSRRSI